MWLKINTAVLGILAAVFLGQCGVMVWDYAVLHESVRLDPDARFEFPFSTRRSARYFVYLEYRRTKPTERGLGTVPDSDLAANQIDFEVTNAGSPVPFHRTGGYQDGPLFKEYVGYFEASHGSTYVLRAAASHEGVSVTSEPATLGVTIDPDIYKGMYVRQTIILEVCVIILVGLAIRHLYRSTRVARKTTFDEPHN